MTPERREEILDRLGREGLEALVRDADLRADVRGDAELRGVVRALADLDDRLAALPALHAPEPVIARAVQAARAVVPEPAPLPAAPDPTPDSVRVATGGSKLVALVDTVFAFADRLPVGLRVVGGSLAVGALALLVAVPALVLTRSPLSGGDFANTDEAPTMDDRFVSVVEEADFEDMGEFDGRFAEIEQAATAMDEPVEAPAPVAAAPPSRPRTERSATERPSATPHSGEGAGFGGLGQVGTGTGGGGAAGSTRGLGRLGGRGEWAQNGQNRPGGGDFARPADIPPAPASATTTIQQPMAVPPVDTLPAQEARAAFQTGLREGEGAFDQGGLAMDVERSRDRSPGYRYDAPDAPNDDGWVDEDQTTARREFAREAAVQNGALAAVLGDELGVVDGQVVDDSRAANDVTLALGRSGSIAANQPDANGAGTFGDLGADGDYGGEEADEFEEERELRERPFHDGLVGNLEIADFEGLEAEVPIEQANGRWRPERDADRALPPEIVEPAFEGRSPARALSPDLVAARSWLAERDRVDGVETQPATGYWRNTYVPGDPLVRGLQQQVREAGGDAAALLDGARRPHQPWDPPTNSAMAVYVHADQSAVDGPRRMLVEVGLQGTERQTGRRPAMNVGVVLDLRADDAADGDAACALLESLAEARDIGDRFSVVVAGREGELLVQADEFGWGAVRVACDQLFGDAADLGRGGLDLASAWDRAFDTVLATDDPTAALGSSFVWVVTPGLSTMDAALLEGRAHAAAVDGVPTSVVGLGGGADTTLLDRVALAGQGHRRLVGSTDDAEAVVDAEITAISRVVARAVRLRIRLAPGVQLVDVIGSERLDEVRAEQVRQAEQAIDQRLSRNLGIQADRGEDEDGIQIVIPAFMADDHHVILLDVIADGPGAVVDVTARYKDLVHLRNGVSRGHLSVPRGDVEPGPLALNVTRNLVAWDVARALTRAASHMDVGARDAATDELRRAASLVRGLRATVPGFASDASLDADLDLLADAIATTGRAPHGDPGVARALRAAGWLKLFTAPETGDDR